MGCMVSVICLVYNHEKYLRKALDGMVMQKASFEYEIIIHDDASTDGSASIIREYELKYPGIVKPIYQTENQYSRGKIIIKELIANFAQGKYIAFCEGDDYWTDDHKLAKQISILEDHEEYSGSTHNQIVVDDNEVPYESSYQTRYRATQDEVRDVNYLYENAKFAHTASMVIRRNIFTDIDEKTMEEFYSFKANGDLRWNALAAASGKIYHFAEDMACYRFVPKGNDSWSSKNSQRNISYITYEQLKHLELFFNKHYETEISYQGCINNLCFSAYVQYVKKPNKTNKNIVKLLSDETGYGTKKFIFDVFSKIKKKIIK